MHCRTDSSHLTDSFLALQPLPPEKFLELDFIKTGTVCSTKNKELSHHEQREFVREQRARNFRQIHQLNQNRLTFLMVMDAVLLHGPTHRALRPVF